MEDRKYTLTFASGFVIEEARLNGNNFITRMEVSKDCPFPCKWDKY